MNIQLQRESFYLGEPIPVEVSVENPTTAEQSIPDPASSLEVEMHVLDLATGEDLSYTMGKSTTTVLEEEDDQWALSLPVPQTITLAGNSTYRFSTDLNTRLFLRDGKFDVYLSFPEGESEHVEVEILFREPSLSFLSHYAMSPEMNYSRREWAMELIQQVYPGFVLKLAEPGSSNELVRQYEAANQTPYDGFMNWRNSRK